MQKNTSPPLSFYSADLLAALDALSADELDALPFGVIQFNDQFTVVHYNRYESVSTGLLPGQVIGQHVFTQVAQCMNNYMVALRFEEAIASREPLDATLDYVLTWRMRPTPVKLRLLWGPVPSRGSYLVLKRIA